MLAPNSDKFGLGYWNRLKRKSLDKSRQVKAGVKARLKVWFDYWIRNCSSTCEECGAPINRYNANELYAAQAHIVPKSLIESVCDVLDNHMTLGAVCGCHGRYDNSWQSARKMKIWAQAVERFKTFAHLITDIQELRKLPDDLRAICDNSNHQQ